MVICKYNFKILRGLFLIHLYTSTTSIPNYVCALIRIQILRICEEFQKCPTRTWFKFKLSLQWIILHQNGVVSNKIWWFN